MKRRPGYERLRGSKNTASDRRVTRDRSCDRKAVFCSRLARAALFPPGVCSAVPVAWWRSLSHSGRSKINGRLDALVNNAGISPKSDDGGRLNTLETDLRTWGKVFHVNFFASVVLARGLKDELSAAKGAVVNVTSIAGARVHPFAGAAYSTSKAALAALTREMAHDFGPLGVRVNAIAPGEVETSILSPGTEKIVETLPLRRLGQPSEVADVIYFLCSDQSSYVTGTEIEVNAGQHV